MLSRAISVFILLVVVITAFLESKGIVRYILTLLLLMITTMNYLVIYLVSQELGVLVHFYPLFVVEQYGDHGAFYPDLGQISLFVMLILWKREVIKYLRNSRLITNRLLEHLVVLTERIKNTMRSSKKLRDKLKLIVPKEHDR